MGIFIVDANLLFDVPVWRDDRFQFVLKINASWEDDEIWNYAKEHELIIVTKDKDFILKQAFAGVPPKVVHIKFGNLKLNDFINRIQMVWNEVEELIQTHSTVNIYLTYLEAIK